MHFHTHDTSGIAAASVLAAIAAGADAVDGAVDAMSGLTSQPNLGSIVEALRYGPRDTGIDPANLRAISMYWEQVRKNYLAFESDIRSGASEVYVHGMPGGQYTNLKEQARSVGLDDSRWPEVSQAYADVNQMFGNIVKVTPSSKVVGDLALMMVSSGITKEQVLDPNVEVAFPESVVQMMRGDLGRPEGGWPEGIQKKVLKDQKPLATRPGAALPPLDLAAERKKLTRSWAAKRPTRSSPPISCTRRSSSTTRGTARSMATAPSCRRRCFSTAWSRVKKSASTSSAARRSSCVSSRSPKCVTTARARCSSS